jgi:transcriptional regulator GlxA family with amidase domain
MVYKNDFIKADCDNKYIAYLRSMKEILILVPTEANVQTIHGPQLCFDLVNQFLFLSGQKPVFNVRLAGSEKEVLMNRGRYTIKPDLLFSEISKADIVFIPALLGDMKQLVLENDALIGVLKSQYNKGAELASLCVGAFLLAATGLLDGKKCSTHCAYINQFRDMFPQVNVQDGAIVTEEARIYSSGGANSYWNLLLHLVEKYTSREMAIRIAKHFAIDLNRSNQSVFALFEGQKTHDDETVKKAQEYIEQKIDARISVEELADQLAVGRRSFERRFKLATKNSVLEYIHRVKIEAAKRSFENSRKNINEVMFEVGYNDNKAFRTIFKKVTGLTPIEYRNKYSKLAVEV